MELSLKIITKFIILLLCITLPLLAIEHDLTIENTNFTLSKIPYPDEDRILYNYNRLRLTDKIKEGNWFATIIADIDNYYGKDYIHSSEYQFLRAIKADTPFNIKPMPKIMEPVKFLDVCTVLMSGIQMKNTIWSSVFKRSAWV